jgi:hypothetical protein
MENIAVLESHFHSESNSCAPEVPRIRTESNYLSIYHFLVIYLATRQDTFYLVPGESTSAPVHSCYDIRFMHRHS